MGMSIEEVAKRAGVNPSDAKLLRARPAVIQLLTWDPARLRAASPQSDAVYETEFSFFNNSLFRIVVKYDRDRTEGLTTADMVDSISTEFGEATYPDVQMTFGVVYDEAVKVSARWENDEYSINLVQSTYRPSFGLIFYSKRLNGMADAAVAESIRLDAQEAPQKEIDRLSRADAENRAQEAKARSVNKQAFKP